MRKYIFIILIVIGYSAFNGTDSCFAMDAEGCLTCHQYPGLVLLEKPNSFKVLHIDEKKYLNSPHGRFNCRKCHTEIEKVPHTDETDVSCTVECHHDDKEEINAIDLTLDPVHKGEKYSIESLETRSSCRVCHALYPHSEHKIVRAFVNMHAGFMICEVCHLRVERLSGSGVCDECHALKAELIYVWTWPERVKFKGEPYGRYINTKTDWNKGSFFSGLKRIFSSDNNTSGERRQEDYSISRVTIISVSKGGKKKTLMNIRDTEAAVDFRAREKRMDTVEKEMKLKYFHRDIARHEISVACEECHSENSMLDYKKLGFGEIKSNKLKRLNIKGLITKYRTFFFPKLLDAGK
ncbi:MAG: hypothetical protein ABFR82_05800 [Nitrospirota bacterium]